jgi:branched-chain amino acid transport system permease protein
MRRIWPLLPLALLIAAVALLGASLSPAAKSAVTTGLVQLAVVIGLYTFVGLSGVFSFGHVAFVAIGAYIGGVFAVPLASKELLYPDLPPPFAGTELSPVVAILVGGIAAGAVGVLLALVLGRLAGLSASLATFALLVIVHEVARNYAPLTRGLQGVLAVPPAITIWTALIWALIILTIAFLFQQSRLGLQLRATREDPIGAQAVGAHLGKLRGIALVLSAFLVGLAGGVYAELLGSFNPDTFYLDLTLLVIAMLVVGGMNSLSGAVVGSLVLTGLSQVLRNLESTVARPGLTEVGFALVTIGILVLRPSGITGGREVPYPRFLDRGTSRQPPQYGDSRRRRERSEEARTPDGARSPSLRKNPR